MPNEQSVEELRNEVRQLREEQERLRHQSANGRDHNGSATGEKPEEVKAQDGNQADEKKVEPAKPPLRQRARTYAAQHPLGIIAGVIVLVALIVGTIFLLRYLNSFESTDDAFIDGHLNPIGTRIAGTVTSVSVENNQFVNAGQVLATLDPRDNEVAVEQARATYSQAQAAMRAENPNVPITVTTSATLISTTGSDLLAAQAGVAAAEQEYDARLADMRQAQAQNDKAQNDVHRYQLLVAKDEISKQQFDTAVAAANSQSASVQAARTAAEAALKSLDQRRAQARQAQSKAEGARTNAPRQIAIRRADLATRAANTEAAKAMLDQARLNLDYTKVIAPVSGIITSKNVEPGQRVQPGEALLSISQVDDIWITANFKETQLRRMRPGQSVDIHVDAFDLVFHGYVADCPAPQEPAQVSSRLKTRPGIL